jgi:uncharacterized protein YbcI
MSDVERRGEVALRVSNALAALYRERYGRGPTTARTIIQDSYAIGFLSDIYTPFERTLIEAGRHDVVRQTRTAFQAAIRDDFIRVVEEATGRTVVAFLSQIHFDPDLAVETFVLADPA